MRKYFVIALLVFLTGCATLGMIAEEATKIKSSEVRPYADSIGILVGDSMPPLFGYPAAYAAGWVSALIRRVYKKKKGSTA